MDMREDMKIETEEKDGGFEGLLLIGVGTHPPDEDGKGTDKNQTTAWRTPTSYPTKKEAEDAVKAFVANTPGKSDVKAAD